MLATKQYLTGLYELVHGPYIKQVDQVYAVEGAESRSLIQTYSVAAAREGLTLGADKGVMKVALVGDLQSLKVPTNAKVEVLGIFGWKTLWNGSLGLSSAEAVDLVVPAQKTVRIHLSNRCVTLALRRGKDDGASLALDWRSTFGWGLRGSGSMLVHAGLFALLLFFHGFEFPWDGKPITLESIKEVEKLRMVDVVPAQLGGFDGTGFSIGGDARSGAPVVSEAKAKAVTSNFSKIVSRLSNISFGAGSMAINVGGGGENSKTMAAVQAGLSKGRGSDLNSGLEKVAQGVIGKNMKWGLYGNNGQSVSQRDQEEVANIFRALQGEFRNCYEAALLKDSELSVVVNYEAMIVDNGTLGSGAYDMSGTSTADGQKHLTGCLSNVLTRVKVSRSLNGVKIKNQFIFKS